MTVDQQDSRPTLETVSGNKSLKSEITVAHPDALSVLRAGSIRGVLEQQGPDKALGMILQMDSVAITLDTIAHFGDVPTEKLDDLNALLSADSPLNLPQRSALSSALIHEIRSRHGALPEVGGEVVDVTRLAEVYQGLLQQPPETPIDSLTQRRNVLATLYSNPNIITLRLSDLLSDSSPLPPAKRSVLLSVVKAEIIASGRPLNVTDAELASHIDDIYSAAQARLKVEASEQHLPLDDAAIDTSKAAALQEINRMRSNLAATLGTSVHSLGLPELWSALENGRLDAATARKLRAAILIAEGGEERVKLRLANLMSRRVQSITNTTEQTEEAQTNQVENEIDPEAKKFIEENIRRQRLFTELLDTGRLQQLLPTHIDGISSAVLDSILKARTNSGDMQTITSNIRVLDATNSTGGNLRLELVSVTGSEGAVYKTILQVDGQELPIAVKLLYTVGNMWVSNPFASEQPVTPKPARSTAEVLNILTDLKRKPPRIHQKTTARYFTTTNLTDGEVVQSVQPFMQGSGISKDIARRSSHHKATRDELINAWKLFSTEEVIEDGQPSSRLKPEVREILEPIIKSARQLEGSDSLQHSRINNITQIDTFWDNSIDVANSKGNVVWSTYIDY